MNSTVASYLTLHLLFMRLRKAMVDLLKEHATNKALGPLEVALIRITAFEPVDSDALRRLAALDKVTFSKSIKKVQEWGFVQSATSSVDRRRRTYSITPVGRVEAAKAQVAALQAEEEFLRSLHVRERQMMMRLLAKLTLSHADNGTVRQDSYIATVLGGHIDPGTLLRRAVQISTQFFYEECADFGLSPLEAGVLQFISRAEPIPARDLPGLLALDRSSAFNIVGKLTEMALVDTNAKADRILRLNVRNMKRIRELEQRIAACECRTLEKLSPVEAQRLQRVMRKLHANLADLRQEGGLSSE